MIIIKIKTYQKMKTMDTIILNIRCKIVFKSNNDNAMFSLIIK